MPRDIAVVVSTYRRPQVLRRLIDALAEQTLDPARWELVVVDNCSKDPDVDAVLDTISDVVPGAAKWLRTSVNRGPAAARNLGWRSTNAAIIAFTDDDVVPSPEWLEAGLNAFTSDAIGVIQGPTRLPEGSDAHDITPLTVAHQFEQAVPYFPACNIFYRRIALEQTDGFSEELAYWGEDTALGWQVLDAGWEQAFCGSAIVTHDLESRPLTWWLRAGWREQNVIALAARHPGFRREVCWRSWAVRPRDSMFLLAVVSVLTGLAWRPALVGVLPYLWKERPSIRNPQFLRRCIEIVSIDAARSAGHVVGSARNRVLIV